MGTRIEYLDDEAAPAANSLVPAASSVVVNKDGAILLQRRADNAYWSLPGGAMEPGEDIATCCVRETREETGIEVEIVRLIGIYSNPRHVVVYSDGEVRQEFSVCFSCRPVAGVLRPSTESTAVRYVDPGLLAAFDIHPSIRRRIADALASTEHSPPVIA